MPRTTQNPPANSRWIGAPATRFAFFVLVSWSALFLFSQPAASQATPVKRFTLSTATGTKTDKEIEIPKDKLVPIALSIAAREEVSAPLKLTLKVSPFQPVDTPAEKTNPNVGISRTRSPSTNTTSPEFDDKEGTDTFFLDANKLSPRHDHVGTLTVQQGTEVLQTITLLLKWPSRDAPLFQWDAKGGRINVLSIPELGRGHAMLDLSVIGLESDFIVTIAPGRFLRDDTGEEEQITFESPKHRMVTPILAPDGGSKFKVTAATHEQFPIGIDALKLAPGATYRGWIDVTVEVGGEPFAFLRNFYQLKRAKPSRTAKPVISGVRVVEETGLFGSRPRIVLTLDEANGRAIRNLRVRHLKSEDDRQGLGSSAKLHVRLHKGSLPDSDKNSTKAEQWGADLWTVQGGEDPEQSLAENEQAEIVFSPKKNLGAGEHKIKLQLQATNVAPEDYQEIELTYRVLHPSPIPVLVLVLSVVFSYFVSRGIGTRFRHHRLNSKISQILTQGGYVFDSTRPPVVQMRVELARIQGALDQSSSLYSFISVPVDLEKRLEMVEKCVPVLRELADRSRYWSTTAHQNEWVKRRALRVLREISRDLAKTSTTVEYSKEDIDRLAELEQWEDPNKLVELYWLHLKQDILQLKAQVVLRSFPGPDLEKFQGPVAGLLDLLVKFEGGVTAVQALRDDISTAAAAGVDLAMLKGFSEFSIERVQNVTSLLLSLQKQVSAIDELGIAEFEAANAKVAEAVRALKLDEQLQGITAARNQLEGLSTTNKTLLASAIDDMTLLEKKANSNPTSQLGALGGLIDTAKGTQRELIRNRLARLQTEKPPADAEKAVEREREYAALKLIWKYRDQTELDGDRAKMIENGITIDEFMVIVDDMAWEKLRAGFTLSTANAVETHQELQPINFRISPDEEGSKVHYLYKHGLIYRWKIKSEGTIKKGKLRGRRWPGLEPEAHEPEVIQFIPSEFERVTVSATVSYPRETKEEGKIYELEVQQPIEFATMRNEELRWRKTFQRGDVLAVIIAVIIALITGLNDNGLMEPAKLGSIGAYLKLIAWGIVAERVTKNLKDFNVTEG